jgi:Tetratricopeptide repeat
VLGDDHPNTLGSTNNLATVRRALGDLDDARELLERALAGYRRVLGENHPATLTAMNNLAEVRREIEELEG